MNNTALDLSCGAITGPRQAALLLHSFSADDREWILGRIPPEQRTELRELLRELRALGLQPDRSIIADTLQTLKAEAIESAPNTTAPDASAQTTADDESALVRALPSDAVVRVLLAEPDRLIVALLRLGPWPWQAELFAQMPLARQQGMQALLRQASDTPASTAVKRKTLLRSLLANVAAAGGPAVNSMSRVRIGWSWQQIFHTVAGRYFWRQPT